MEKFSMQRLVCKSLPNVNFTHQQSQILRPTHPMQNKKPNKETLKAMQELQAGKGVVYKSMDDFWKDMGITPPTRQRKKESGSKDSLSES
jgi:hypothetical protein